MGGLILKDCEWIQVWHWFINESRYKLLIAWRRQSVKYYNSISCSCLWHYSFNKVWIHILEDIYIDIFKAAVRQRAVVMAACKYLGCPLVVTLTQYNLNLLCGLKYVDTSVIFCWYKISARAAPIWSFRADTDKWLLWLSCGWYTYNYWYYTCKNMKININLTINIYFFMLPAPSSLQY